MQDDINALVRKPAADVRLDPVQTPDAIRSKTGLERRQAGLVESEEVEVQSTDGVFTFIVRVIKA